MNINKNSVLYNGIILVFSNCALQLLGFIYRIFLSDFAGAEGLGIFRIIISAYTVINAVCLSGIIMALSKITSELSTQNNYGKIVALKSLGIRIFLILFLTCAIPVLFWNDFIAINILKDIRTADALLMMLGCLFLTGFENINKAVFIGIQRMDIIAKSECTEQIIRIFAVVGLLYFFKGTGLNNVGFFVMLGMTISEIFSVLYLTYCYQKNFGKIKKIKLSKEKYRSFAEISIPITISALINNILSSADAIILPQRLVAAGFTQSEALSELGIISGMTMPIIMLPIAIIGSISTVVLPNISKSMATGNKYKLNVRISRSLRITGLVGVPATCAIIPLSPYLLNLLFDISVSYNYLLMLGISVIFIYYQIITGSVLNGMGQQKLTMTSSVIGEVVQLFLLWNLVSIPKLNIYGYIISIIIAPLIVTILNLLNINRFVTIKFTLRRFLFEPILCGTCVYFWVCYIFKMTNYIFNSQVTTIIVATLSAFVVYLIILKITGIKIYDYINTLKTSDTQNQKSYVSSFNMFF